MAEFHNPIRNRQDEFTVFRERHPVFRYTGYHYEKSQDGIRISFDFDAGQGIVFHPSAVIRPHPLIDLNQVGTELFDRLVFHVGMIELISYWKSVCSPVISIETGYLNKEQVAWWKKLYFHGLGEFFYLNGISADADSFVEISAMQQAHQDVSIEHNGLTDACLVPVGGGKDSSVTLDLLKEWAEGIVPFTINPIPASIRIITASGIKEQSILRMARTIDPLLLKLNQQDYLNGHTPFSAMLAFYSLIAATLRGTRYIVLSNESSASEATIPGTEINHQYSKSISFERDFRYYVHHYLSDGLNYFSLMRPVSEYQIGGMFASLKNLHGAFRSCNAGSKTDTWCASCAKCLFTQVILAPFLDKKALAGIFGRDLFRDESLFPLLMQLSGLSEHKPFDCVGTVNEVRIALDQTIAQKGIIGLPALLNMYTKEKSRLNQPQEAVRINPRTMNTNHFVPDRFLRILNDHLWDIEWPGER